MEVCIKDTIKIFWYKSGKWLYYTKCVGNLRKAWQNAQNEFDGNLL